MARYELVFVGAPFTRRAYKRWHASYAAAQVAAWHMLEKLQNRAAHPAIIYGPGCGKDGVTIA